MHLRRNRNQRFENKGLTPEEAALQQPKEYSVKKEPSFDWDQPKFSKEVRDLGKQRKKIAQKIQEIENRLRFGYSEPLYDYKMELIKEDVGLSCKMIDALVG